MASKSGSGGGGRSAGARTPFGTLTRETVPFRGGTRLTQFGQRRLEAARTAQDRNTRRIRQLDTEIRRLRSSGASTRVLGRREAERTRLISRNSALGRSISRLTDGITR